MFITTAVGLMNQRLTHLSFALILVTACAGRPVFEPGVVALFDGGEVTAEELDERILQEAPGKRTPPADGEISMADWRRQFARQIVAERSWLESMSDDEIAREEGLSRRLQSTKYSLLVRLVHREGLDGVEKISEEDVREVYDKRAPSLVVPESFTLRHVYLRVPEGAAEDAWEAANKRAESVRDLLKQPGADVDAIIVEHSDSEDARLGGWIRRLQLGTLNLSASFEETVRSLEPGEISDPIRTRRGYQVVFLVDHSPGRQLGYEELRDRIYSQLQTERNQQASAALMDRLRVEDPLEIDLGAVATGDPEEVAISGPGVEMTLAELRTVQSIRCQQLEDALANDGKATAEIGERLLDDHRLYRYGRAIGLDETSEFEEMWSDQRRRILAEFVFNRHYQTWLDERKPEEIRAFYDENRPRFATPRQLHLRALFLEYAGPDLYATFDLSEKALERLVSGEPVEQVAADIGAIAGPNGDGDYGWNSHEQIAARGRVFYEIVLDAEPDEWFGPIKWNPGLRPGAYRGCGGPGGPGL